MSSACSTRPSGVFMWAIMRKPMASMPRPLATLMCCSVMSASVQCTAMRATCTPISLTSRRSSARPMPGSSRHAIFAFVVTSQAFAISSFSGTAQNP